MRDKKLAIWKAEGVRTESTPRWERRRRGVAWVTVGVIMEWRIVGMRIDGGHM